MFFFFISFLFLFISLRLCASCAPCTSPSCHSHTIHLNLLLPRYSTVVRRHKSKERQSEANHSRNLLAKLQPRELIVIIYKSLRTFLRSLRASHAGQVSVVGCGSANGRPADHFVCFYVSASCNRAPPAHVEPQLSRAQ